MNYKIVVTQSFEEDIDLVLSYITKILGNPIAAKNLLEEIETIFNGLSDYPYAFPVWNKNNSEFEYHYITVKSYIVFYRINEAEKTVYISRLLYSKRNIDQII